MEQAQAEGADGEGRPALHVPVPTGGDQGDEGVEGTARATQAAEAEAKARAIETSIIIRDDD